jgi:hypothetical protein
MARVEIMMMGLASLYRCNDILDPFYHSNKSEKGPKEEKQFYVGVE